jgi:hypothetical protein
VTEQHDDTIVRRRTSVESASIAGIVYAVAASVTLLIVLDYPQPDLPDAELEAWFADDGNRWRLLAGLNLGTVAAVAFLWFVGVLRNRIGDREDRFFGTVFYGSAIIYASFWIIALAALASIPAGIELFGVDVRADSGSVGAIGGFAAALLFIAGPKIQALFVMSTSTIFLRTSTAPKWLAFVGYAFGIVLFLVPVVARPIGVGFPIWVFVASITVLVTKRVEHQADAAGTS